MSDPQPHIGQLTETSLHAALKAWIARPDDRLEAPVGPYVVDVVRDDRLIEIQTGHFTALKRKLADLLAEHRVELVYPIPREKWIVRQTAVGHPISRRKSPKRGRFVDAFYELVRIPHLLPHPRLSLTLLLTQEEEIWRDDGQGSWRRRGWSVADRRLLAVVEQRTFVDPVDWLALLPVGLERPFTNRALAGALGGNQRLAQKITYTLRGSGLLAQVGLRGRAHLYDWGDRPGDPSP